MVLEYERKRRQRLSYLQFEDRGSSDTIPLCAILGHPIASNRLIGAALLAKNQLHQVARDLRPLAEGKAYQMQKRAAFVHANDG